MSYIRVSGRFEAQLAVLTGSDNIGNYNTHATGRIVVPTREGFKPYDVPIMTGNSLKHWHAVYLAKAYENLGGSKINELCKAGLGLRGYTVDSTLEGLKPASSESEAIEDVCNDLHGFLITRKNGKQTKRDSLVKFSLASPVLDAEVLEYVNRFSVIHNRVDPLTQEQQMVFKQEYSSSPLYGFNVVMDLDYVCRPMYEEGEVVCDQDEVKRRKKSSVLALLYMFTGIGSKQARALPVARVTEVVSAVSDRPVPNLVHGSYKDYVQGSLDTLAAFTKATNTDMTVICYNAECKSEGVKVVNTKSLEEFFNALIGAVSK
ncbi:type I-A CRISPR-associated protein Cas7/Csa2 [Stygiolobus caldivivus]|uniref:CRISPR-associated protein DevR n=1 Tax=Stygiolobus caldivivus TaxID=2824673 RepID=A0A8D5U698_9CREN|nr:type I-A CRISPR-associated protein Cas7/Csa2 [Stygiolobus caldivivus]BCU69772.1 CRISPR-associated protein DevR [Stygiolobus caldivivus]